MASLINLKHPAFSAALYLVLPYLRDRDLLSDNIRQRLIVSAISLAIVPLGLLYTFLELENARLFSAALQLNIAVAAIICYYLSRSSYYRQWVPRGLLIVVMITFFSSILLDTGPRNLFYLFLIPPFTFFLFGLVEGGIWALLTFVLAVVILQAVNTLGLYSLEGATLDFVVTYLCLAIFSASFEALRQHAQRHVEQRNRELLEEQERLKRSQQELASSETRFKTFSELASDYLFELDGKLQYTFASPRLFEILGGDIYGKAFVELAKEIEGDTAALQAMQEGKQVINEEIRFKNFQGENIVSLFSAMPRFDLSGRFIGIIGAGKDITKIREAQEELRFRDQSLHHIQKLEALGQLTSGVAHDFNNLLTVISGNLELLDNQSTEPERERIDSARRAISRAASLTNQLLSFSRKQDLKPLAIDVKALIGRITEMCSRTMGSSVFIQQDIAENLQLGLADEGQLESALLNLALNGRDAMSGQGELTFRARNHVHETADSSLDLSPGNYLCISVIDDGVGIEPRQTEKILEPFFTTKPSGEGTGLGLSMVFGFASQSGGALEVQSELGQGATFSLYLPQAEPSPHSIGTKVGHVDPPIKDRKVVLVEDDPDVRQVLESNLNLLGYSVTSFDCAEDALECIEVTQPDILISDLMLGKGINGIKLANQLRQSHPRLPILLISGNPDHIMSKDEMAVYSGSLLRKPFTSPELQGAIQNVLVQ